MDTLREFKDFFKEGYKQYLPGLSIDCAIFGYQESKLQIILVKHKILTKWCLPGGYIRKNENLDQASARITLERTGIGNLFLKQFRTFGEPGRNEPHEALDPDKLHRLLGLKLGKNNWLSTQTISVGYYAITDIGRSKLKPDFMSSECSWFPVDELPSLGFDHDEMVREALSTMRRHLHHFPVGKNLLPDKFTLKDIRHLYQVLSGKQLHATNFPNKLIKMGLIIKLNEKKKIGAHRSPAYYRFNDKVYMKSLKEGLVVA